MRPEFFSQLYEEMKVNPDVYLLVGDLGYGGADHIKLAFPQRFINCGAAEQAMVDIAVGLALEGKIPFVYTITSFYLRAAEQISLYLSHEQIPVHLAGSGRDGDYAHDGFSHDATQAQKFLHDLDLIEYYPHETNHINVREIANSKKPSFISLKR